MTRTIGWLGLLVVGCSGGDPGEDGTDTTTGPAHPLGATIITPAELDELAEQGTIEPVGDISPEAEIEAVEELAADAEESLAAFVSANPRLDGPLVKPVTSSRVTPSEDGQNHLLEVAGQTVLVQGNGLQARSMARFVEQQTDPQVQRDLMDALVAAGPPACETYVPADPSAFTGEELAALNAEIAECTADWWSLVGRFDDDEPLDYSESLAILPECDPDYDVGEGWDGPGTCGPNVPLSGWSFSDALPPVRSQGRRGSCVAFATVSALEYTTARFTGEAVDLSEQDAYAKGKYLLFQEHYTDGLPTQDYLYAMAALGLPISMEEDWGYNPSACRGFDLGSLKWLESCRGYSGAACSDTSHQLGLVATSPLDAYWYSPPTGDSFVTIEAPEALPVWGLGTPWNAKLTALVMLQIGYGLVASLEIDEDFADIGESGRLPYRDDEKVGNHAVHVVRWMSDPLTSDGIVVIKNSWGCGWGDGGYAYLEEDWFFEHLTGLTAIRSSLVGDYDPPVVEITAPSDNAMIELSSLGADVELRATASDADDAACCEITWWSDTMEQLGTGDALDLVIDDAGVHRIFVFAEDAAGNTAQDSVTITLTNTGPTASILRPAEPPRRGSGRGRVGVRVPVGAEVPLASRADDPNQPSVPCADRDWFVDGVPRYGRCDDVITLDEPGWSAIRLRARDDEGAEGNDVVWVRAAEWTEADGVYAAIVQPASPGILLDAQQTHTFAAEAVTAHPDGIQQLRWVASYDGNEIELGTGLQVQWRPADDLFDSRVVTVRVEVTDANGTTTDRLTGLEVTFLTVP